jgi:small subunit ribosomal protein S1
MKAVLASPWSDVAERFKEGTVCAGEVVRIEAYGAFVHVAPGVDGLVHVSELALGRIVRPQDVVQVGQNVQVQVKSLDLERQRLSLSMKALLGDPWDRVREKYAEDMEIEGTVEKVEEFGIFVTLEPGLTGLIPLSESNTERGRSPHRDFMVGNPVKARILAIDEPRRRLTLTRRSKEETASDEAAAPAAAPQERQPREARDGERKGARDQAPREDRRTDRREERGERRDRPSEDREKAANKAANSYRENTKLGTFADLFPAKLRRKD